MSMIWFSCKLCGKTHGRPESAVGATIFCECGTGLLVPWESTAAEPPAAPPAPEAPPALKLEPVQFDPVPSKPGTPPLRSRKRGRVGRRDPLFCFNHEEVAKQTTCADCGESFCADCLVTFAGDPLCGPCKNYRVKNLQRTVPPSNLSIVSLLTALLTGLVSVLALALGGGHSGFPWWSLVALLPQGLAAGLALMALREAERDPKVGGRSLALTGLLSAAVTCVLIVLLTMYSPHLWT
jgi:hypothetical protein